MSRRAKRPVGNYNANGQLELGRLIFVSGNIFAITLLRRIGSKRIITMFTQVLKYLMELASQLTIQILMVHQKTILPSISVQAHMEDL